MRKFIRFESGVGEDLGSVWTCHECGSEVSIKDVILGTDDLTFVTCPGCHGRGVYVAGEVKE